jgi:membrane protein DedA with SNARE-associated domain
MLATLTHSLIEYLNSLATVVPLPWFTFLGSFIEEIIAPIPSPLVMTLAGSLAATGNNPWTYLGLMAFVGAIGKTLASSVLYVAADKGEDLILNKFGKFFGVSHKQVESIGNKLNKGWRDDVLIIILRAVPIIPSAPVSIICGLIKLNLRTYITSTFIGTTIRNLFYLGLGYTGVNATESIILQMENYEVVGYIILAFLLLGGFAYFYYQKNKDSIISKLFTPQENKHS